MVVHTCTTGTWEAEVGGSQVQGQLGLTQEERGRGRGIRMESPSRMGDEQHCHVLCVPLLRENNSKSS
jgi:hypothetical protein